MYLPEIPEIHKKTQRGPDSRHNGTPHPPAVKCVLAYDTHLTGLIDVNTIFHAIEQLMKL